MIVAYFLLQLRCKGLRFLSRDESWFAVDGGDGVSSELIFACSA
jgi:hypothetical protein